MASLHKDNEQRFEEMCRGMEEMRQAIRQDLGELAQSMRCDDAAHGAMMDSIGRPGDIAHARWQQRNPSVPAARERTVDG
jgi:hypothetical protein